MAHWFFTCFVCVLIADFITGIVHWFEDNYLDEQSIVGQDNIEHHNHPERIGYAGTFYTRNWFPIAAGVLAYFILVVLGLPFIETGIVVGLASLSNEVHMWNHRKAKDNPWWVQLLQDMSLVQTRVQHNQHHRDHTRCYCVLTNWLNPFLDSIEFWDSCEFAVWFLFWGTTPRRFRR